MTHPLSDRLRDVRDATYIIADTDVTADILDILSQAATEIEALSARLKESDVTIQELIDEICELKV